MKYKIFSVIIIVITIFLGYFYIIQPELKNEKGKTFPLGLDLIGGSEITYNADVSKLKKSDIPGAMSSLKETLIRRLNPFGTSEVSVSVESASVFSKEIKPLNRVIIEIPGVSDPEKAKKLIGKIPLLEFKTSENPNGPFVDTELTGKYLKTANITRDRLGSPAVSLTFTSEGGKIFADLTKKNVGKFMAIFLDGKPISVPRINQAIISNNAIIEGDFTLDEAKELARNLKFGALPVPISIDSSDVVSASLGKDVLNSGLKSALFGILLVILFLIGFYRISGLIASISLVVYVVLTLAIFKSLGFVFTSAGIAGFIISIGMAVDANVLIFERIKDELRDGQQIKDAIPNGFKRA